ncbi:MAG TPA: zf-HC2 domain-containing protein [Anaeromyxobacteraceae bacterium]|nr:zf-HC2 domain-containing protein [Anaeromyxobacteraceae bacterium]
MSCRELEPLLAERAAGALSPVDEARVTSHLAGCEGCRAHAARLEEVLSLARAPAASVAEERLARDLPVLVAVGARRSKDRSRALGLGLGLGFAAATALAVAFVAPGRPAHSAAHPAGHELAGAAVSAGSGAEAESYAEVDAETLWDLSADIDVVDDYLE